MVQDKISNKYKRLYRIIAILGFVLLLASCIYKIFITIKYGFSEENTPFRLVTAIMINTICIFAFLLIILKPERLEFFSIISFIYMIDILISDYHNLISVFMAMLCIVSLYARGFFIKKMKFKIILFFAIYLLALSTEIRFGYTIFIETLLLNIGAFFTLYLSAVLIEKQIRLLNNNNIPKIIDLTQYKELSEQDKIIIQHLKNGQKYDWIAGSLGIATPTVKKHVKRIFRILDVVDLIDFHAKLGSFIFIYTKEELLAWKKKFLEEEINSN